MNIQKQNWRNVARFILTIILTGFQTAAALDLYERYQYMLREPITNWKGSFFLVVIFFVGAFIAALTQIWKPHLLAPLRRLRLQLKWTRWIFVIAAGVVVNWFFLYTRWSEIYSGDFSRLWLYLVFILLMSWLATPNEENSYLWSGVMPALILFSSIFVLAENLQVVREYPFPLSWSEGNRLWDYSVLFGRRLYEYPANKEIPALIDIGRQSLWGLPFLLPNVSIQVVRFWSAMVFTLPYFIFGLTLFYSRRQRPDGLLFLCGLWALVFLNQGPIYSPLILAAIVVVISRRVHPVAGLIMVLGISYYASISRFTWMFAPAIWAGVTALIQPHARHQDSQTRRWGWAIANGIAGVIGGFIIPRVLPIFIASFTRISEGSAVIEEGIPMTSTQQPLIWERLLPNPTYAPGILLGTLLASLPFILLIFIFATHKKWKLDLMQKIALIGSSLAFLIVGLVISVKIGGGSNLHNLDMFLVSLVFAGGLAWYAGAREWVSDPNQLSWKINILLVILFMLPVLPNMMKAKPLTLPEQEIIDEALLYVQDKVSEYKEKGEILFIDQRQLLTFNFVETIPLVPEYEKKRLMNEAMSYDENYFQTFYQDLAEHRFALIISEPLNIKFQGSDYEFGDENDVWVHYVTVPVFCYYESIAIFREVGMEILVPRIGSLPEHSLPCPIP